MKCKIRFDSTYLKTCSDDKYSELRALAPKLPVLKPTDYHWDSYEIDIVKLASAGAQFEILQASEKEEVSATIAIHDRLLAIEKTLLEKNITKREVNINIEQSHEAFLTKLTKVEVKEDYCTEDLQRDLDDGWRIVAVCYQKGNRRPDYVLGKES